MASIFGVDIATPSINISGFLSSSWLYVVIISFIGIVLIGLIAFLLFLNTFKRKIILFENVSGLGYQPVLRTRARIIKLGAGGEEILKTLAGGHYVSAYGRKMGKNTYWYCKGQDGYWYNIVIGDLDTKLAVLDIDPVDRDVRMFHVAVDKLSSQDYGRKAGFIEKYGVHMMLFIFLIIMIIGFWVIAGKINEGLIATSQSAQINKDTAELQQQTVNQLDNARRGGSSGIVPADEG